eukprot:TRINITY_DN3564_c0_g1_i3.p1 TRINITY_DN3564_c0_g1~~TRINITY_DN3564_c0_g1_i3.p1  ORF type:complete len:189 (-),score=95.34 TRINITY_DN3564_c0_g1_i3:896-1462(-)
MEQGDDEVLEKAEGTKIDWHSGKSLTEKFEKQKPKGSKAGRPVMVKVADLDSFFSFFSPAEVPGEDEEFTEEEAEALQEVMELDYELGTVFTDHLIPNAVRWFTGEAARDEEGDESEEDSQPGGKAEEDEEDEQSEAEEEEEDDSPEEEEEEQPALKRKAVKGGQQRTEAKTPPSSKKGTQVQDCKQQ